MSKRNRGRRSQAGSPPAGGSPPAPTGAAAGTAPPAVPSGFVPPQDAAQMRQARRRAWQAVWIAAGIAAASWSWIFLFNDVIWPGRQ